MLNLLLANLDAGLTAAKQLTAEKLGESPVVVGTANELAAGDYAVYGVLLLLMLVIFAFAFRQSGARSKAVSKTSIQPDQPSSQIQPKSFNIPEVMVGESDSHQVRVVAKSKPTALAPENRADSTLATDVGSTASVESSGRDQAGATLRAGLSKTKSGLVGRLASVFSGRETLDDDLLGELEEVLFTADIGVRTSQRLVEKVQSELRGRSLADADKVWSFLKEEVRSILVQDVEPLDFSRGRPFVIMVVGVNGAGKTTTIGKLASQFKSQGKSVMLAAGDTFRAAAVEQLEVWGERVGVPVVRGQDKQDPASVLFEATQRAQQEGIDILLADTAGRLQAKKGLMDELQKVHRVLGKALDGAPHEVWLVLDSTNGQNAISQAKEFLNAVSVSGLILTKLDGTAKGGVAIGITDEMHLPIRYVGVGEGVNDLQVFNAETFAEALLGDSDV